MNHRCFELHNSFQIIEVFGKDAEHFLHTLSTANIVELKAGHFLGFGIENALLDKTAHILFQFQVFACGFKVGFKNDAASTNRIGSFKLLINANYAEALKKALMFYLFDEDLSIEILKYPKTLALEGRGSAEFLRDFFVPELSSSSAMKTEWAAFYKHAQTTTSTRENNTLPWPCFDIQKQGKSIFICSSPYALEEEQAFLVFFEDSRHSMDDIAFKPELEWHIHRKKRAKPFFGDELEAGIPALNTGMLLSTFLHKNKGCYIGQEIIARSLSRMKEPTEQLMALIIPADASGLAESLLQKILQADNNNNNDNSEPSIENDSSLPIFRLKSVVFSEHLGKILALAYVRKDFASDGGQLPFTLAYRNEKGKGKELKNADDSSINKKTERLFLEALVKSLPLKELSKDARLLRSIQQKYEEALRLFHVKADAVKNEMAKRKFKEILALYPEHAESIEALAVIAEAEGHLDTALALNKKLADLQPQAIMPRTNLSRLYMHKGEIEKAEAEKQKASLLTFKQTAKESSKLKEERSFLKKQAEDRMKKKNLFKQALEIDDEDEIALFALGRIFFEEKNLLEAENLLKKLIKLQANYSLAYLFYAKTLIERAKSTTDDAEKKEELFNNANTILSQGIHVARQQGEMMPLRSMEFEQRTIKSLLGGH